MKNKLTLKSLQQELENMKVKSGIKKGKNVPENLTKGGIGHDIKNSYIQRLYMRSSGFTLYLITGLLAYAHKIPFIGRIISLLGLYYGRTTIWKILIKVRKIFIVINALIGVYLVFKSVGFSTDNLLVGFIAVGESYFIMLKNLTYKLFTWFVELFDHKIIPNVPGDNGGTFFSKPKNKSIFTPSNIPNLLESDMFSLRKLYKDATPNYTPWYKDTTTWLWIIGTGCTIGVIYLGYCVIADPSFIPSLFKSNPTINTQGPTPPTDPSSSGDYTPDITIGQKVSSGISFVTKGIVSSYKSATRALNPFTYFGTAADTQSQFNLFMEVQNDYLRANRNLYPFTEHNPFDSWFKKFRLSYIGESAPEFVERTRVRMYADKVYESLKVTKGKMVDYQGGSPIFSAQNSPYLSTSSTPAITVGLNTMAINAGPSLADMSSLSAQYKLSKVADIPLQLPTDQWVEHAPVDVGKSGDGWKTVTKGIKNPVASSSKDLISPSPLGEESSKPMNIYNFKWSTPNISGGTTEKKLYSDILK